MQHYHFTRTGRAHARQGMENQDRMRFAMSHDIAIQVMGDGMSGEALGEEAAQIAVEALFSTACSTMLLGAASFRASARVAIQAGFASAFNALQSAAVANEWDVGWMQTTLMAVIYDSSTGEMVYGYVGDGLLAAQSRGACLVVEQPQKGSSSNQTYGALDCPMWRFGHMTQVSAVCMATDGIGDCLTVGDNESGQDVSLELADLLTMPFWQEGDIDAGYLDACFASDYQGAGFVSDSLLAPLPLDMFDCVEDDRSIALLWSDYAIDSADPVETFAPVGAFLPVSPVAKRADRTTLKQRISHVAQAIRRPKTEPIAVEGR